MASHASRFSLLDLPRPWRSALPLLAFALVALALEADPRMRLAGAAAAGCFGVAASLRALQARAELRAIRRAADRLILSDAGGYEGSELVRWRINELVAPASRLGVARELDRVVRRLDPTRLPSASPLRRGLVRRHEELLRRLERRMRDARPVTARGVLLLQRLLREAGSPLYDGVHESELSRAIAQVLAELEQ